MMKRLLLIVLSFSLLLQPCFASKLPDLGDPSLARISQHDMDKLSKDMMTQLRRSGLILNDLIVTDYIKNLGNRLVKSADMGHRKVNFFVMKSSVLNAFAGPGGNIAVNSGLILAARNESELAAVMAHEIAHVRQHHIERFLVRQKDLQIPMIAGLLASIAIGMKNPQAGNAAMMSSMAALTQNVITFTRSNEIEADNIGMQSLSKAGFDPRGMAGMFKLLQNQSRLYDTNVPEILLTHPVTTHRIAEARARASQLKVRHVDSSDEFYMIQSKVRVETSKNNYAALNYFTKQLKKHPKDDALNYGYALALSKSQNYKHADTILLSLIEKHPSSILLTTALAKNYLDQNKFKQADYLLQQILKHHPKSYPLQLEYAMCLINTGEANKAVDLLLGLSVNHRDDASLYGLLAQAQSRAGDKAAAYFSRAQAFQIQGNFKKTTQQLLIAQKLNKNNKYLKAMIDAKLAELNYKTIN